MERRRGKEMRGRGEGGKEWKQTTYINPEVLAPSGGQLKEGKTVKGRHTLLRQVLSGPALTLHLYTADSAGVALNVPAPHRHSVPLLQSKWFDYRS